MRNNFAFWWLILRQPLRRSPCRSISQWRATKFFRKTRCATLEILFAFSLIVRMSARLFFLNIDLYLLFDRVVCLFVFLLISSPPSRSLPFIKSTSVIQREAFSLLWSYQLVNKHGWPLELLWTSPLTYFIWEVGVTQTLNFTTGNRTNLLYYCV